MRITWHGHSCFEITGSLNLVFDPHDGYSLGLRRPDTTADVIAISHDHFDHNKAEVVWGRGTSVVKDIKDPGVKGLHICGFKAFHDTKEGNIRGDTIMYRFTMQDITGLHVGDLGHILDDDVVDTIGDIDLLFLPVGGKFTLDHKKAVKVVEQLDPRIVIPMHYRIPGLRLEISGVKPFLNEAGLPILPVGSAIDFELDDLPEHREIWLFDYR